MTVAATVRPTSVLVTGSAGFIAAHLLRRLHGAGGFALASVDRRPRNPLPGETFVRGDLSEPGTLDQLPPADVVCHLAGQTSARRSQEEPFKEVRDNIVGVLRVLAFARRCGARHVVFTSSMGVYGEGSDGTPLAETATTTPASVYGADKLAGEHYCRIFAREGMSLTVLRLFNVYGPGQDMDNLVQGMASIYLRYVSRGEEVPVTGSLDRFRDFVYVDDVVDALVLVLRDPVAAHGVFNVGTGVRTSVRELIDVIAAEYGHPPGRYPARDIGAHSGDVFGNVAAIDKLMRLGWRPRHSLQEGIAKMAAWLKAFEGFQ